VANFPAGTRVLVHGAESQIHALGILSAEKATEVLRTAVVEGTWNDEEVATGAQVPLRVVYRTLDHFHCFAEPINLADLGWSPDYKPINGTICEMPDGQKAEDIWQKAVDLALTEKRAALLK
jgi:hypothetical protein